MPIFAPYVIERSSRGERSYDIFSRLLMDRIVFLGSPINDDVSNVIIAQSSVFTTTSTQIADIDVTNGMHARSTTATARRSMLTVPALRRRRPTWASR